jgi:signal transduction histidine kinase
VAFAIRTASVSGSSRRDHAAQLEVRAEELESFASRVAHDLLSPLSARAA